MALPFEAIICDKCGDTMNVPIEINPCGHHFCFECVIPSTKGQMFMKWCPKCKVPWTLIDDSDGEVLERITEFECKMAKINFQSLLYTMITFDNYVNLPDHICSLFAGAGNIVTLGDPSSWIRRANIFVDRLLNQDDVEALRNVGFFKNLTMNKSRFAPLTFESANPYIDPLKDIPLLSHFADLARFKHLIDSSNIDFRALSAIVRDQTPIFKGMKLGSKLGRGAFGHVYNVVDLKTNINLVVKLAFAHWKSNSDDSIRTAIELSLQNKQFHHPFIAKIYSGWMDRLKNLPVNVAIELVSGRMEDGIEIELAKRAEEVVYGYPMAKYEGKPHKTQ